MKRLLLALCLAPLMAIPAWAHDLTVSWQPPRFNADSTNCMVDSLQTPLTNFRGTRLWLVNFAGPDTVYLGEFGADVDSIDVLVPDGMAGEVLGRAVKMNGLESCIASHYLFTTEAVAPIPPPMNDGSGLRGQYFTYDRWNSFKAVLGGRIDSTVAFDWGAGGGWGGGPADYWSVRWTGTVETPTAGAWTFYVDKNDGHRLWIDGVLVQDQWGDMSTETASVSNLSAGEHVLKLEYYEGYGNARCRLSWAGPGVAKQIIPKGALKP